MIGPASRHNDIALPDRPRVGVPRVRGARVSWFVGIAIGVAATAALAVLLLYIPHWMLTGLTALSRSTRVAFATAWIAMSTLGLITLAKHFGRPPVGAE